MKEIFYKPLKVKADPDNILVWGCLHYDHDPQWDKPLWHIRGYKSAKDHNEGLVKNWNSKANENTIGFLLGDTIFGMGGAEKLKDLFNKLKFKELYICGGNHTACFWQLLQECSENIYEFYGKKVTFYPNYFETFINGQPVVMSHYPILSFNGQGKGSFMLFAHVHGRLKDSRVGLAYLNSGARVMEVSVDVNPFPLTWVEINRMLKNKKPVSFDGHGETTNNPF